MKIKITQRLQQFLNSKKDYPVLAAFSVGYYSLVFYFSNNFDSVNSWSQFIYFLSYFILGPIVVFFLLERIIKKTKFSEFTPGLLTILMIPLLIFYLLGSDVIFVSIKRISLFVFIIWCIWKFKIRIYKYLIVFIFLMAIIPTISLASILFHNFTHPDQWGTQPDHILNTKFKTKPNVYYIQTDGYINETNFENGLYKFDNSKMDFFLKQRNFTAYTNHRSNYPSTLYSNSSCFAMKHHHISDFSQFNYPRDIIMGANPVLQVFKNNQYKTFFITEMPYFTINRPTVFYDYYNFQDKTIARTGEGGDYYCEITQEIKKQIESSKKGANFFFIQKFAPNHVCVYDYKGATVETGRVAYIESLRRANVWLNKVIPIIELNDPNAIIIIGADHGGYVGFKYFGESTQKRVTNKKLLQSIFGAKLAIKWNDDKHYEYDKDLKSSVNLFRVLFSYLSKDKSLLKNMESDKSYHYLESSNKSITPYPALDENGNVNLSK